MARGSSLRSDGSLSTNLTVTELSDGGEIVTLAFHDVDDVSGAVRSMVELYIESLDPGRAATMLAAATLMHALATKAFETASALFADDLRLVDFRESPAFEADTDSVREGIDIILDDDEIIDFVREVPRVTERGLVVTRAQLAPDTLEVIGSEVVLIGVRGGKVDIVEVRETHGLEAALARLAELTEG